MMLNEKQINKISSLISEGVTAQKSATEAKKKYLDKVKSELVFMYNEGKAEIPSWVELIDIPVNFIREGSNQTDSSYPDNYVIQTIQLLKDIRTEYYLEHQLQESHKQTCWALGAFLVSLVTLLVTICK